MRSCIPVKMTAQICINYSHMKLRQMVVAQRSSISVNESQAEGHDCNLSHKSTEMGYELKIIVNLFV